MLCHPTRSVQEILAIILNLERKGTLLFTHIIDGKASPIPSAVSQAVGRAFKFLARPYDELAQCIKKPEALEDCLQIYHSVYSEDKNLALISQVLEHQEMQRIAALRDTISQVLSLTNRTYIQRFRGSKHTS